MKKTLLKQWIEKLGSKEMAKELVSNIKECIKTERNAKEKLATQKKLSVQFFGGVYDSQCTLPDEQDPAFQAFYKSCFRTQAEGVELEKEIQLSQRGYDAARGNFRIIRGKGRIYIFRNWLTYSEEKEIYKESFPPDNEKEKRPRMPAYEITFCEAAEDMHYFIRSYCVNHEGYPEQINPEHLVKEVNNFYAACLEYERSSGHKLSVSEFFIKSQLSRIIFYMGVHKAAPEAVLRAYSLLNGNIVADLQKQRVT